MVGFLCATLPETPRLILVGQIDTTSYVELTDTRTIR
eukprot:COSAG01_NODE_70478_length_258_cov_0.974843_1_plen_36_part_10